MKRMSTIFARFLRAVEQTYTRKWSFLGIFVFIFGVSTVLLGQSGLLPDTSTVDAATPKVVVGVSPVSKPSAEDPIQIKIPKINLSATIANPTTTNIEKLDQLLLKGAVRYPSSAKLGENGNVVLFGHSSYLPFVGNMAYKTFDGIQKLVKGDLITVYSADMMYTYRVRTMQRMSAKTDGIPLAVSGKVLTLSTCNSFATKSDRFVVTADFVGSHSITTAP